MLSVNVIFSMENDRMLGPLGLMAIGTSLVGQKLRTLTITNLNTMEVLMKLCVKEYYARTTAFWKKWTGALLQCIRKKDDNDDQFDNPYIIF